MAIERIQLRRGTAQQWADTNPILAAAEVGVELGTPNKFKIGDGSSTWSELDYFSPSGGLDFIATSEKGTANGVATLDANGAIPTGQLANIIDSAPEALNTLSELASALADDADFATTVTSAIASKADASHTHTKSDITNFSHTHLISEVADLSDTLANLESGNLVQDSRLDNLDFIVNNLDFASTEHTHTISDISDISSLSLSSSQISTSVVSSSATSYTLQPSNKNMVLVFTSSSPISFSVVDSFQIGDSVVVVQDNTGQITISGTGVFGAGTDGGVLKTRTRYSSATILKIGSGQYRVFGDLAIA